MAEFFEKIHASPMWDESQEMLIPGELEYRSEQPRKTNGIPISQNLYDELIDLGNTLGVDIEI